jgi:hypothetical protein
MKLLLALMAENKWTILRQNPDTNKAGIRWTRDEDTHLIDELSQKMSLEEIAKVHQRTVNAINIRRMQHGLCMGLSMSAKIGVSEEELQTFKAQQEEKGSQLPKQLVKLYGTEGTEGTEGPEEPQKPTKVKKPRQNVWQKSEDDQLLAEVKMGLEIDEIAKIHQRTIRSVENRLWHLEMVYLNLI